MQLLWASPPPRTKAGRGVIGDSAPWWAPERCHAGSAPCGGSASVIGVEAVPGREKDRILYR